MLTHFAERFPFQFASWSALAKTFWPTYPPAISVN